jgi:hypothetical protein
MIEAPSALARLVTAGALIGAAALILALSGCGGDTAAKAGDRTISTPTTAKAPTKAEASPTDKRCAKQVGAFLEAMDGLRERLVAGLSYEEYVEEIDAIQARYDEVPVDDLAVECLLGSGTPGERAFTKYIDAANAWGECIGESDCDAPTVEPILQKQWRVAAHFLDEANQGPGGSS